MEKYKIEFLKTAKKELAKLPRDIQQRIAKKINALTTKPYPTDVKPLKNGNGRLRIRVGDYRIIYKVDNDKLVILVIKIGHRSQTPLYQYRLNKAKRLLNIKISVK